MPNRFASTVNPVGAWLFRAPLAVAGGIVLLAACQSGPPTLSLEEAKQVTATFEGGFVPPPRTIKDITAILDQQTIADPEETARRIALADRTPPKDADPKALASFFHSRGMVAYEIGRERQWVEDLRTALRYGEKAGAVNPQTWYWLAVAERSRSNYRDAIRYAQLNVDAKPNSYSAYNNLVQVYPLSGDLESAERAKRRLLNVIANARGFDPWQRMARARAEYRILEAQGRYAEGEPFLRREIEVIESAGLAHDHPAWLDWRRAKLANYLSQQGRLVESEIVAREALLKALKKHGKISFYVALLVRSLGVTLRYQGRYEDAEALLRAAIDIYEKAGTQPEYYQITDSHAHLAMTLFAQGDWQGAVREFDWAREANKVIAEQFFANNPALSVALMKAGRTREALTMLSEAYEKTEKRLGAKHMQTAQLRGALAAAYAATGNAELALSHFGKAVPVLLSRSRQSTHENTTVRDRDRAIRLMLESYIGLLADIRGTQMERKAGIDAVAEAFRIADFARSQSVQSALAASGARAAASDPDLADLVRRAQDAEKQTAGLYALLADVLSAPTDQQDPKAVESLRGNIDQLRGARATLMDEIEARFPDYAELINPKPATAERARLSLNPGEALITTYVGDERTYVWALPHEGEMAFAAVDVGREGVSETVALLRSALQPNAQVLGDIPDFDVAAAYGLYEKLLEPVEAGWKDAESLLVAAHGPLGYLPLSLLPTKAASLGAEEEPLFANHRAVPWLARSHAVTMLPSVASLATLRALPPGDPGPKAFAGFGDPWFSAEQAAQAASPAKEAAQVASLTGRGLRTRGLPVRLRAAPETTDLDSAGLAQLPRLPDTADEVRSIAVALKADLTRDVFLGERANEGAVKTLDLSGYRVLAFATHGLVPGDLDGLMQPALALSAPDVANDPDNDGLLTMGEILGLKLDADWVVLSACNTGSGQGAGAEAVSGLGRAFFYAGTRAILVSNWPVQTTSATALTTDLFRRQAEDPSLTRAEALRRAMLALIDGPGYVDGEGRTVFSCAHPIFWAPFTIVGDGGGGASAGS